MAKWQLALVGAFLVVFGLTVILTGNPIYLIAAVMIAVLVVGWSLLNRAMTKRVAAKHDSIEDAMSDESEPIPSTHLIPDNETAAGDTPEAHDEINPHDLPADHTTNHNRRPPPPPPPRRRGGGAGARGGGGGGRTAPGAPPPPPRGDE